MSVRIAQIDSRLAQIKIEFTHNEQILIVLAKERLALTNERILLISPPAPTQAPMASVVVFHWDTCMRQTVSIVDIFSTTNPLASFFNSVRCVFLEELGNRRCLLYSMPSNYTDVNQRERIQTSEELMKFITERAAQSATGFPPSNQLYVFNDDSPLTKLPEFHAVKFNSPNNNSVPSGGVSSSRSSDSSCRSQMAASRCRERDSNSCVFCGYSDYSERSAAHIFDLNTYTCMDMGERKKHLTLFGLETINSLSNILCLCSNCHEKFDAPYLIGIHPREHQLVVSPRMGSDDVTQGGIPFRSLHGNVFSFNGSRKFSPSVELLEYRFSFFKNSTNLEEKVLVVGDGVEKGSAIYKSQEKKRTFSSFGQTPSITKWFKRCPAFEPQSSNAGCKLCGLLLEKH